MLQAGPKHTVEEVPSPAAKAEGVEDTGASSPAPKDSAAVPEVPETAEPTPTPMDTDEVVQME